MHPAFSVIFFTTASGAGYGLMALLSVLGASGAMALDRSLGIAGFGLSFVLVSAGLLSSTFHLGHPERAWRALTQWRSSWLSREGVASIVTYGPWLATAYLWIVEGEQTHLFNFVATISAVCAGITVYCTAMIYRQLKTVHQWHNGWTVAVYMSLAVATGTVWLAALASLTVGASDGLLAFAALTLLAAWWVKRAYWRYIDTTRHAMTPKSATGLKGEGVRLLEGPHTEENYLQREMGFQVARKHAAKLRRIVHFQGFFVPALMLILAIAAGGGWTVSLACGAAAVSMSAGIMVERWLFFAQARHVVTLYYGAQEA